MKTELKTYFGNLIKEMFNINENVEITIPSNTEFGDFTSNIALKISKKLGKKPIELAEEIKSHINNSKIKKVEIKNPGFINLFVDNSYLYDNIFKVLLDAENYGKSDIGNGQKYNIEFVSANPTGILHLGMLEAEHMVITWLEFYHFPGMTLPKSTILMMLEIKLQI